VFVAELGPLSSPELGPAAVASALGLAHVAGTASYEGVAGRVGARKLLLVIDNCEHVIGRCFVGVLMIKRGDALGGLNVLRTTLGERSRPPFHTRYDPFLGELADALCRTGRVVEGLVAIDEALDRATQDGGFWYVAELLRIKGGIVLHADAPDVASKAEKLFRQALEWARRQDALSWELRAATSLARLYQREGRTAQARKALAPVYGRFTEGFETAEGAASRAGVARHAARPD
jgi:predicted ATPase